ncbi:hypothetical protein PSP6_200023 [Paraburkholderia tropica]|nr:hypothetical protein PSP6_200023 [Paraburkholderia tropica]
MPLPYTRHIATVWKALAPPACFAGPVAGFETLRAYTFAAFY